jgi:hypothetical protein
MPSTQILEVKGCGLALIDFDADGDLDLFAPNGATLEDPEHGPGCWLFENIGGMKFRDATATAGLGLRRWSFGVAAGDYDGNGFDDLYIACYGPNVLLKNSGGRFEDAAAAAGCDGAGNPRRYPSPWSTSAAFGDLDGDGDLDLYVTHYARFDAAHPPPRGSYMGNSVLAGPLGLRPEHDVLFENLGDGTFRDASESSGCRAVQPSYGLNAAILDFNADGRQDIFVANDSMANFLFLNREGLRFEEVGVAGGIAANLDGDYQATMGIAIGDVDGNGFPDVFTTNFSSDMNTLHLNLGGGFFEDRTQLYGLGRVSWPFLGWACAFYDLDHDGDEDLLVLNGHVYPEATPESMDSDYEQTPLLFAREGPRFARVGAETAGAWLAEAHRDRTAVFGDLDQDGDIDVVAGELNGPLRVLRNDAISAAGGSGNWLIVELRDERPAAKNRRLIGSRIELLAGAARETRWIYGGGPFQSTSAPYAHFAVAGGVQEASLRITWPDGSEERLEKVALQQHLVMRRR